MKPQVRKYVIGEEDGRVFILNPLNKGAILTLLQEGEMIAQCMLSDFEMYIIDLLFTSYLDYAPMEELLAVLRDKPVDACLSLLSQVADSSDYKAYYLATRSVRNAISTCRKRLLPFEVEIQAIDKTGYEVRPKRRLKPYTSSRPRSYRNDAYLNNAFVPA